MTGPNQSPRRAIPLNHALDDADWARARQQGIRIQLTESSMAVVACNRIGLTGYGRTPAQALADLEREIMRHRERSVPRR